jgi:hypothetical protein
MQISLSSEPGCGVFFHIAPLKMGSVATGTVAPSRLKLPCVANRKN